MRLIGLLSWYDEAASWLSAAIASHHRLGLTHLIAVDGAYALYPDGRARSGIEQHHAISDTCEGLGISSLIYTPPERWAGNEVEKRSFMFNLGLTIAQPEEDWFVIIDADHLVTEPDDLTRILTNKKDKHAAEITLWERPDTTIPQAQQFPMPRQHQSTMRIAYRANPGLHCAGNHYTYKDAAGRVLWTQDTPKQQLAPCIDATHIRIEHRTRQRDLQRHQDSWAYYRRRDELEIERTATCCDWEDCTNPIHVSIAYNFEQLSGTEAVQAGTINVCPKHLKRVHYENRVRLAKFGIDYGKHGENLQRHGLERLQQQVTS